MITKYQDQLTLRKNMVIAELESKEELLISKVCVDPYSWDSESLQINQNPPGQQMISMLLGFDVKIIQVFFEFHSTDH